MWIKTREEMIEDQKMWCDEDAYKEYDFTVSDLWACYDDGTCVPYDGEEVW